MQTKADISRKT